jgi:hypothetical protein
VIAVAEEAGKKASPEPVRRTRPRAEQVGEGEGRVEEAATESEGLVEVHLGDQSQRDVATHLLAAAKRAKLDPGVVMWSPLANAFLVPAEVADDPKGLSTDKTTDEAPEEK